MFTAGARLCVSLCIIIVGWSNLSDAVEIDRAQERAKMMEAIRALSAPNLVIENQRSATARARMFLSQYERVWWPLQVERERLGNEAAILKVAIDRALWDDEVEHQLWEKRYVEIQQQLAAQSASVSFKSQLKRMARLAHGLPGELAQSIRQMYELDEIGGYTEAELPLVNRLIELRAAIDRVANASPITPKIAQYSAAMQEVEQAYRDGKISITEASQRARNLYASSDDANGQYVATQARASLDESAIIRTKLARAKGFETWADFALAQQKFAFRPGYQTVEDRSRFLRDLLMQTKDLHARFLKARIAQTGAPPLDQLTKFDIPYLALPGDAVVRKYFPNESIEKIWRETVLASGFQQQFLDRVTWDNYPRENKYSHAYMYPVVMASPHDFRINAESMELVRTPLDPKTWDLARIYIVQNFRSDSPDNLSTALHEGGHALDFVHRESDIDYPGSSAWAEVHSFTWERFLNDREFLRAHAVSRDGERMPEPMMETYLLNQQLNEIAFVRGQYRLALYELDLWDYAYEEGGIGFVDRAAKLADEGTKQFLFHQPVEQSGIHERYRFFATGHFYSGDVRYIGYIYARIAADMTEQKMLDRLEALTGRRSLYQQPAIANMLISGYYRDGFRLPFPSGVEAFIGEPYSVDAARETMISRFTKVIEQIESDSCQANLNGN